MSAKPRADADKEFRERVLSELVLIRDYFDRERAHLLREITDLRAKLAATKSDAPVAASE